MTASHTIRETNDRMRREGNFGPDTPNPLIVTPGVQALGEDVIAALYLECMSFSNFTRDEDPFEHHDMGTLTFAGTPVWFKIDQNPEDADLRIVTFLLPDEH